MLRMFLDVESVGLYGDAFAYGFVVCDEAGKILQEREAYCPFSTLILGLDDFEWVKENVIVGGHKCSSYRELRDRFWKEYQGVHKLALREQSGAVEIWADCCFPVETSFLATCIRDELYTRKWQGPHPLFDIAPLLKYKLGKDPTQTLERKENELPAHNALNDARQSARLFYELGLGEI